MTPISSWVANPLGAHCLVLFRSSRTEDGVKPSRMDIYEADLQLRWALSLAVAASSRDAWQNIELSKAFTIPMVLTQCCVPSWSTQ